MRFFLAFAAFMALCGAASAQNTNPASAAPAPAAPASAAPAGGAAEPAPAAHAAKARPEPEADLSGLKVRPDIVRPDQHSNRSASYIYNADGVNCSLYPARCR